MTPKEKAQELVEKFAPIMPNEDWKEKAKQCAIIAVDEIIKACPIEIIGGSGKFVYMDDYWNEVKKEVENV